MTYRCGREDFRAIVAAKNQKEAAGALRVSVYHLRGYASVTGNKAEIETALRKPGTVFLAPQFTSVFKERSELDMPF